MDIPNAAALILLAKGEPRMLGQAIGFLAASGRANDILQLIRAGADVNCFGGFPLDMAAEHGKLDIVRLLLSHGATATPSALEMAQAAAVLAQALAARPVGSPPGDNSDAPVLTCLAPAAKTDHN